MVAQIKLTSSEFREVRQGIRELLEEQAPEIIADAVDGLSHAAELRAMFVAIARDFESRAERAAEVVFERDALAWPSGRVARIRFHALDLLDAAALVQAGRLFLEELLEAALEGARAQRDAGGAS